MNEIVLPRYVTDILARLEGGGFEAYLVGGCIRDAMLGREPSDYDIATSALPEDMLRMFPGAVPTGAAFGTVTVYEGGGSAEITSFRAEGSYSDRRRPEKVTFGTSLEEDLSRRDFTVNAMAYSPLKGIIDPFGGRVDIEMRQIRAVGAPDARFKEDALRILRAFRFAVQLGFKLEPETMEAARALMPLTAGLSGERVEAELDRVLLSRHPSAIIIPLRLGLFEALGIKAVLPEDMGRLDRAPATLIARWAACLFLAGCDSAVYERLRFSNKKRNVVAALIGELKRELPHGPVQVKMRMKNLSPEIFAISLDIREAFGDAGGISEARSLMEGILRRKEPYKPEMLAFCGSDLKSMGIPPGPVYGVILNSLLGYVIENPDGNNPNTLRGKADEIILELKQ